MKTIWKFPLELIDEQDVMMPKGAKILSVHVQVSIDVSEAHEIVCLWALVDPDAKLQKRVIEIFGTGNPIDVPGVTHKFIGTVQMRGGSLVWHVFEQER